MKDAQVRYSFVPVDVGISWASVLKVIQGSLRLNSAQDLLLKLMPWKQASEMLLPCSSIVPPRTDPMGGSGTSTVVSCNPATCPKTRCQWRWCFASCEVLWCDWPNHVSLANEVRSRLGKNWSNFCTYEWNMGPAQKGLPSLDFERFIQKSDILPFEVLKSHVIDVAPYSNSLENNGCNRGHP